MAHGFEWDPRKNAANIAKHGIDFEDAIGIFERAVLEFEDTRRHYGERRLVAVGVIGGSAVTVVYTPRGGNLRIISARRARRHERAAYREAFPEDAKG
jgi:uncharacterized DUF497 family protein